MSTDRRTKTGGAGPRKEGLPGTLRGLLYDLDGVLVDSVEAWFHVIADTARRLGYEPPSFGEFCSTFGQGIEADRLQFFPGHDAARIAACYEQAYERELVRVRPAPGAGKVLAEVRRRGLLQAVVTNTPERSARRVLELTGLSEHLDALAAAGQAAEKPAPDLLLLALRQLGLGPKQVLFVGDSLTDVAAARAAGVRMVGLGDLPASLSVTELAELLVLLP